MANNTLKAQMAIMAALSPEQFIEMAVQQGFTPENLAKSTGLTPPTGAGPNSMADQIDRNMQPVASMGAPPASGNTPIPMKPSTDPTVSVARNFVQPPGAPPPPVYTGLTTAPPMAGPTGPSPTLESLMGIAPQMGAPPIAGAVQPGANPQPGNLGSLVAPNAATAMPAPLSPSVAMPQKVLDVVELMAGALGGVGANMFPPTQSAGFMGAPPTGALPPQAPAMGNPGEVSPVAMAGVQNGFVQPTIPAPQQGIGDALTAEAAMNPEAAAAANSPSALSGTGIPPWLFSLNIAPDNPLGLPPTGGTSAGPNVSQFDLMSGVIPPPQNAGVTPPVLPPATPVVTPPPPPVETSTGPTLKPTTSAGVEVVSPEKDTPASGKPTLDALAAVGKTFGKSGRGGGGDSRPGSAGVRTGAIQQGELLELIMKGLLKPGQYSPGFIPMGKF